MGDAEIIHIKHSAQCLTHAEKSRIMAVVIITKKLSIFYFLFPYSTSGPQLSQKNSHLQFIPPKASPVLVSIEALAQNRLGDLRL